MADETIKSCECKTVTVREIAVQLATASRIVAATDFFWVYTGDGTQVKIPAEYVRAYLLQQFEFKSGDTGILVSTDGGSSWTEIVGYEDITPALEGLVTQYEKMLASEQERQDNENNRIINENVRVTAETNRGKAETARATAETARVEAEKKRTESETKRAEVEESRVKAEAKRVDAEKQRATAETLRAEEEDARVSSEAGRASAEVSRAKAETARETAEEARATAESQRATAEKARVEAESKRAAAETKREADFATAIAASETQTETAKGYNEHPIKVGDNGNWWAWNGTAYVDTGKPSRTLTLYPSFYHRGNKLYIEDVNETMSTKVKRQGNKLVFLAINN